MRASLWSSHSTHQFYRMLDEGHWQTANTLPGQPDWTTPYKGPLVQELQDEVLGCFQMKMHVVRHQHAKECKDLMCQ
jgi:hypothetical protein